MKICDQKKLAASGISGTLSSGRARLDDAARAAAGEPWLAGYQDIAGRRVPLIKTRLALRDRLGSWKMRWAIGRKDYQVHPGLYGVGQPASRSPVLVTANYKMTFDRLRSSLEGIDAWILILDTRGINVWCAAGKGTFGTQELIRKIQAARLDQIVDLKQVILPQLGATGIKAHEVTRTTGFRVIYGPARAEDIPRFLAAGCTATRDMRQVRFNMMDRLVLTPAELVFTFKPAAVILGILFILGAFGFGQYGLTDLAALVGTLVVGCVLTPVLLPFIPGRAFSLKGAIMGLLWAAAVILISGIRADLPPESILKDIAYLLAIPPGTAFLAMNFTGSSTFTSPSGVNREMRRALPPMLISAALGVVALLASGLMRLIA